MMNITDQDIKDVFGPVHTTICAVKCEFCGNAYNQHPSKDKEEVSLITLGSLQICDCCYPKLAQDLLQIMPKFIPICDRFVNGTDNPAAKQKENKLPETAEMDVTQLRGLVAERNKLRKAVESIYGTAAGALIDED